MNDKRRLGRGLDALFGGSASPSSAEIALPAEADAADALAGQAWSEVPIAQIETNRFQPRKEFDRESIEALRSSLETHGLLQPIVVRKNGDHFELIAGERRLRAAKEAGWSNIAVHVVDMNDQSVFEAALVENIQRSDLNPLEKAKGFQEYLEKYKVSQEHLAKRIGVDRATVANLIRLLELPPKVQEAVRHGQITFGHARALLSLDEPEQQVALCKEILSKGMSVRQVEATIKEMKSAGTAAAEAAAEPKADVPKTHHVQQIEDELRQRFATKVAIKLKAADKGQVVIQFDNNDDFERILAILRPAAAAA